MTTAKSASAAEGRANSSERVIKTIGVLGGLGPQATMDFEARVHQVAQTLLPRHKNAGYPPMVVFYYRHEPFLMGKDGSPLMPIQANPRLLEVAARLAKWADFLVMTANAPHLVYEEVNRAAGRPVLSIIELAIAEIERRGWRTVGVLGFGVPAVYLKPLGKRKIACQTIDGELRTGLDRAITLVMEGREDEEARRTAREAATTLLAKNVDGIILGCTEIPLLLQNHVDSARMINPAQLLAEAAVQYAIT